MCSPTSCEVFICGPHGPRVTTLQKPARCRYNSVDGWCQRSDPPPVFGSPWYLWLYRKDFRFCVLFSSGSSIPLAFIGAPMSHPMSHWEQPDTICSDNSLVAASRGSLITVVGLWLTSPCSQGVPFRKRNTKEFWRIICTGFSAAEMSHSNQTNNCQRFRHWFCFHSWVV